MHGEVCNFCSSSHGFSSKLLLATVFLAPLLILNSGIPQGCVLSPVLFTF